MKKIISLTILGVIFIAFKALDLSFLEKSAISIAIIFTCTLSFLISKRNDIDNNKDLLFITFPPVLLVALFLLRQENVITINYLMIWIVFGIASVLSFGYHAIYRKR